MSALFDLIHNIADSADDARRAYHRDPNIVPDTNDIQRIPSWDSTWRKPADPDDTAALSDRVQKLELVVEALIGVLSQRTGLTAQELAVAIQRVDLRDGVEDGAMGPDQTRDAPSCPKCRRPRNPARTNCLYCGNGDPPIVPRHLAAAQEPAAPVRTVVCGGCGNTVPERDTWFTGNGLRCNDCYSG